MTDFISLQNVGAISQAVIPLSETGGVTVFRGRNGCGKSTGLETISTLASGRSKLPPLRDGEKLGLVSGFCSKIDLRLSGSRRGGNKPELVVDSIEGKFSISDLVNPNIKDPKAADNARLKALITLIGVDATPDLFATLFPTKEEFDTNVSKSSVDTTDPILMAERVKRDIEEKARIEEEKTRLPRRNPVVDDVEDLRNAVLLPILFRNLLWFDVFRFRRVGLELGRHHSNFRRRRSQADRGRDCQNLCEPQRFPV